MTVVAFFAGAGVLGIGIMIGAALVQNTINKMNN